MAFKKTREFSCELSVNAMPKEKDISIVLSVAVVAQSDIDLENLNRIWT